MFKDDFLTVAFTVLLDPRAIFHLSAVYLPLPTDSAFVKVVPRCHGLVTAEPVIIEFFSGDGDVESKIAVQLLPLSTTGSLPILGVITLLYSTPLVPLVHPMTG